MRNIGKKFQIFLIGLLILIIPMQALAATSVTCQGTSFTLQDSTIDTVNSCQGDISFETIISSSICLIRAVVATSMFEVYCDIMENMRRPIQAFLTIWIIFYAISAIFGLGDTSGRDVVLRMTKVVVIFAFVSNSQIFYQHLYQFFVHDLLEGVSEIFFAMDPDELNSGNSNAANLTDPGSSVKENTEGIFSHLDDLFYKLIGGEKLVALGVIATVFLTSGVGFLVSILLMLGVTAMIGAFFRILITYAVAILALSFILMFAPIFIAFAMFKATFPLFQGWIGSIVSYTLQPIIVMAFIFLFAATSDLTDFIGKLQYVNPNLTGAALTAPANMKIDIDKEKSTDILISIIKRKVTEYKKLDGTSSEDPEESFIKKNGDPKESDIASGIFFSLAFLILNAIMNEFMKRVPVFAQMLARLEPQANTPAIALSSGITWQKPGASPANQGIYTPDRFFTENDWAQKIKKAVSDSEGAIGKDIGKSLMGTKRNKIG